MRRWLLRILIGIAALIVLVVIGVQIVLWTNIPKNLVVKQIESEMGLRISTDSLRTGWLGRSTLQNVALGLPLSDKSFLKVQTLQVKHTTLFGMIFGRAVSIDRIEIDHPEVFVRQDANGNWNLQEVAEILAKVSGGKTAQESQKQGIPRLPDVRLIEGVVHVTDNGDKEATIAPLSIDGHGEGPLVWKFDVKLAKSVAINGEVAPGNTWKHQVRLSAHDLGSLLNSWGVNSYGADLAGTWDGQLGEGGKLRGTFTVDHLNAKSIAAVGDVSVTGAIDVDAGAGSAVTLRPRRIDLKTSNPALNNVWLAAGTITRDSTGIRAQTMQVAALGGLAVLDASFDPRTFAGDLQLRWSGLAVSSGMNHSGSITAKLRMPFPGQPAINVDLLSQGATSSGKWDAKVNVAGIGQSWKSIDWVITAPTLTYTGSHPIQMAQLVAHVTQRWPSVELADMTIPERPHLQARAAADFSTHNWYFWLDAGGVPHPDNVPLPITFLINAWGNADVYTLHELDLQIADAIIWAGGYYDRRKPNPMNLDVVLTRSPQLAIDAPIQGHLGGRFNLSGRLFKKSDNHFHPQLDITGRFRSNDLVVLDRPVGSLDMQLSGTVDNFDTKVQTTEMRLFQGRWKVTANYPTSRGGFALKVDVHDLPVEQLAQFAKVQNVTGNVSESSWQFEVPKSGGLNHITLNGDYVVQNLDTRGLKVDRIEGKASLDAGVLKLAPVAATYNAGRLDAAISYELSNPRHIFTDVKIDKWPYGTTGGATAALTAATKLDIDLEHKGASGPLSATVDLQYHNAPLSHVDLVANLQGRMLAVQKIAGNLLSGTFDGAATVDIDKPLLGHGRVQWDNVDASALAAITPALEGLGGKFRGTIAMGPARDPRPLEPLRIDVNIGADDGHFRGVRIGSPRDIVAMHAVAYANLDRAVLDHCDLNVADGVVHLWMRAGKGLVSQAAQISFENLQLDQLAHIDPDRTTPMPGLVSGNFAFVGSGLNTDRLLGKGKIDLTQTDLGNWGPIAALYNVMNGGGSQQPSGVGSLALRFEQNTLRVTDFRFFNRGIDAFGVFTVGPSVWDLQHAPVSGQVVGSIRTLKNTRIPLLADFDEIFSIVQGSLTAIDIGGTKQNPTYVQAGVAAIGNDLRTLIVGSARSENGAQ